MIPPRLQVRTTTIEDPGPLLALLPASDAYAWVREDAGLVGWGEAVRYKAAGIADAAQWWSDLVPQVDVDAALTGPVPGAGLLAFGSFCFDTESAGQSTLVVPSIVVGRRQGQAWMTQVKASDSAAWPELPVAPAPLPPQGVRFLDGALSEAQWQAAVTAAVAQIAAGQLGKVVLARDLIAVADQDLDLRWLAARLAERYPRCWTFLVDGLVGASPEMLLAREGGLATSRVLAGTIRRTGDVTRDLLAAALAQSSKDLEEHEYAVQSVARALAPFCSGLHVPDAPYVLELPNVLHLATDVTGAPDPGISALALAAALHPSAAVCGTPTAAAGAAIAELEHLDRERYAGPVGWIDAAGNGEWAIALRCGLVEQTDARRIRLFAGCGIVADSNPGQELAEANAKLVPMRDALLG